MSDGLGFLEELGFKYAGKWVLDNGGKIKADLIEAKKELKNVLYAFVVNEKVVYVGKTVSLAQRMRNYRNNLNDGQFTNRKVNCEITQEIAKSDKDVLIYVLSKDDVNHQIENFNDLIKIPTSLEDRVIGKLSPEWNEQGKDDEND